VTDPKPLSDPEIARLIDTLKWATATGSPMTLADVAAVRRLVAEVRRLRSIVQARTEANDAAPASAGGEREAHPPRPQRLDESA
jgi:hypothetical protein